MSFFYFLLRGLYFFVDSDEFPFDDIEEGGYGLLWGFVFLVAISFIAAGLFYYVWVKYKCDKITHKQWRLFGLYGGITLVIALFTFLVIVMDVTTDQFGELFSWNNIKFVIGNIVYYTFIMYWWVCPLIRGRSVARNIPRPYKKEKKES